MNNQENMTLLQETNKTPITDPEEIEIYELYDKEFRIIFLKKFSKLQQNTDKQLNEIRKTTHEKMRNSTIKEIPLKKQTEFLELNNIISKPKNSIEASMIDFTKQKM